MKSQVKQKGHWQIILDMNVKMKTKVYSNINSVNDGESRDTVIEPNNGNVETHDEFLDKTEMKFVYDPKQNIKYCTGYKLRQEINCLVKREFDE